MNKTYKLSALWMMCLILLGCLSFSACDDGDEEDTNQYKGGISLNVFGPSPVARGGELRFLGSGIDKIQSISIPGCGEITDIEVISANEIRVTVPQTAEVGYVTLKTPTGEITTKTKITYTEPIGVETITPNPVKPGEVLVIKGEYLNLIKEVIFFEELPVGEDDFIAHSRKEIQVKVPMEARTGDVTLADASSEDSDALRNLIHVKGLVVILPSVEAPLDLTAKKPGDEIVVKGKDLDLVNIVKMPNGEEVEFDYAKSGEGEETITFILPENATNGAVVMIPASGVEVAIANIGMALPEKVVATPDSGLRGGDMITLTGINMELVTTVTFPGVEEAMEPASKSATEVEVVMPVAAISGELLLNTASGTSVPVAITTLKPEFMAFVNDVVSLGSDVIIQGKNLDLVAKVVYTGGAEVEVTPTSTTELTIAMPTMGTESGVLTLVMGNGEMVETGKLTINAPEFCYIPVLPGEDEELRGGEVLQLKAENGDKLTGVQVNGTNVQYILTPDGNLFVNIPQMAGEGSTIKLISSNGSIEYTIDFIPATEIENVVMNEMRDLGSWAGEDAGGTFRLYKTDLVKAGFAVGAKLRFYVKAYKYTQIQMNDANWGGYNTLQYEADECPPMIEVNVTQELYDKIMNTSDGWSDTGFIIQGEGCIVNKVSVWYEISMKTYLWKGSCGPTNWNGDCVVIIADDDKKLLKPGKTMGFEFYCDSATDYWQVEFMNSWWNTLPSLMNADGSRHIWEFAATDTSLTYVMTQADIDLINSADLLFGGNGVVITAVYVE